jgi:hypothetical protein
VPPSNLELGNSDVFEALVVKFVTGKSDVVVGKFAVVDADGVNVTSKSE